MSLGVGHILCDAGRSSRAVCGLLELSGHCIVREELHTRYDENKS